MNTILIVLPILTLLMFDLGLSLNLNDFKTAAKRPKAIIVGLVGQILLLPALAILLGIVFKLEPLFFIGLALIACSPGGSSSNVFSMLAKGDVALSVSLTALSSLITLFTIPVIMQFVVRFAEQSANFDINLPMGKLVMQNLLLVLLPIILGMLLRWYKTQFAERLHVKLSKIAFPALILLAAIFFAQHYRTILENIGVLGICIISMIMLAIFGGAALAFAMRLRIAERRTIIIEVGMQNAAQAIAIASSPFIFNNDIIAIPAIIYALLMNVVLLSYLAIVKRKQREN